MPRATKPKGTATKPKANAKHPVEPEAPVPNSAASDQSTFGDDDTVQNGDEPTGLEQGTTQSRTATSDDNPTSAAEQVTLQVPHGNKSTVQGHGTSQEHEDDDVSSTNEGGKSGGDEEFVPFSDVKRAPKRRGRAPKKKPATTVTTSAPAAKKQRLGKSKAKTIGAFTIEGSDDDDEDDLGVTQHRSVQPRQRQAKAKQSKRASKDQGRDRENLPSENETVLAKVRGLERKLKESEDRAARAELKNQEITRTLKITIAENIELRDVPTFRVEDGLIQGVWNKMAFAVDQCCTEIYLKRPAEQTIVPFSKEREDVLQLIRECKTVPEDAVDVVFQRFLWTYLCRHILPLKGGLWVGELGEQLVSTVRHLFDEANGNIEQYEILSRMKSKFAIALEKKYSVNKVALEAFVEDCHTAFSIFLTSNEAQAEFFIGQLREIFEMAVSFQITCLKSRAIFQMFRCREGDFAGWAQPAESGRTLASYGPDPAIHSYVAPGLSKTGTADGMLFNQTWDIVPARVDMRRRREQFEQ